jgi:hypothetical protein
MATVVAASVLTAGLMLTTTQGASAATNGCGKPFGPQLNFDGLGHYVVSMGFTDAKRATAYSLTEYIEIRSGGKTWRHAPNQSGTLLLRSSLTKRYVGTLPAGGPSTIGVVLVGSYTLASKSVGCLIGGYASGGSS